MSLSVWVHMHPHFFIMIISCKRDERDRIYSNIRIRQYLWRWLTISKDVMVNEGIRAREVRLIDQNGEQLGIKSRNEALEIAARVNLDLVFVAPNAKPPVARIMDYGKFRFEQQKKDKEARKNQKVISLERGSFKPNN